MGGVVFGVNLAIPGLVPLLLTHNTKYLRNFADVLFCRLLFGAFSIASSLIASTPVCAEKSVPILGIVILLHVYSNFTFLNVYYAQVSYIMYVFL